ncbi:MAG: hypothetical protein LUF02_09230 [Erysipelotrichaceae bacterium]|nr:hypothetical protein [Erysipelotrichaceae bacterium]
MKVIFLDIDGVINPYDTHHHSNNETLLKQLIKYLSLRYQRDYSIYNPWIVRACYLDWDKGAMKCIKHIIDKTNARIVISSDWRPCLFHENPYEMRDLLHLWHMDQYWVGDTDALWLDSTRQSEKMKEAEEYLKSKGISGYSERTVEIIDYVIKHKEITNYVVLDDMNLIGSGHHFVRTTNLITDEQAQECIKILNSTYNIQNDLMHVNKKIMKNV